MSMIQSTNGEMISRKPFIFGKISPSKKTNARDKLSMSPSETLNKSFAQTFLSLGKIQFRLYTYIGFIMIVCSRFSLTSMYILLRTHAFAQSCDFFRHSQWRPIKWRKNIQCIYDIQ